MAQTLIPILSQISDKINGLEAERLKLEERISNLEKENEELKDALAEMSGLLERVNTEKEFLTVSYRLADNPDSVISARRRIARLIRTIDNCISMLKEE